MGILQDDHAGQVIVALGQREGGDHEWKIGMTSQVISARIVASLGPRGPPRGPP